PGRLPQISELCVQFLEQNQFIRRRTLTGRAFVHLSARLAPDLCAPPTCPAPLVTARLGRAPPFRNRVYDCIDRCAARANNYWSVTGRGRSASVACSYRAISISGPIVRRRGGTCDIRICAAPTAPTAAPAVARRSHHHGPGHPSPENGCGGLTPNTVAGSAAYRTPDRNTSSSISR